MKLFLKMVPTVVMIFYLFNCYGQDTIERKNRLSDSVIEKFHVIKTNPTIKQGAYRAIFRHKTVVALGNYKDNKRTGIWHFYNTMGQVVERYNYDSHLITFEARLKKSDDIGYFFDDSLKTTDTLTRPLKIGGCYFGFIPYLNQFQLPFSLYDANANYFDADVELLISPLGRLAEYKVHVISDFYHYDRHFTWDVSLFSEEDRTFIPATLNGKPILSRIIIQCVVTDSGGLDFY